MVEPAKPAESQETNYSDPAYDKYKNAIKGAKHGEVVTRFPPEPSGFMHIGHCKAAMLNYHYAKMYGGKMLLRFDDTNPSNEKEEYVENIKADLDTLQIFPSQVSYTSDFFEPLQGYIKTLISQDNAYADNTPGDLMKEQRDAGEESESRKANGIERSLEIVELMIKGDKKAAGYCIRAKMDMKNPVKCLRDPVFYRSKVDVPHHRTGTQFKAYPTYDFACPIVDSLEGVTYAMRTIEYHDRNPLYDWVCDKLGLRKPIVYDYSRLNLVSTVLSKRALRTFVESGFADGWYDPRFPTIQGIMRRGMTVQALKMFMLDQGPSKSTNMMEWDKIWAFNKTVIDPISQRYTAIANKCKIVFTNGPAESYQESVPFHPKNPEMGTKPMTFHNQVVIEKDDADCVQVGEKITLMKWGNATIVSKEEVDGQTLIKAELCVEDQNFKGTKKLTWLADIEELQVEMDLMEYDHLITKKKIEENDKIPDITNHNSKLKTVAWGEGSMRNLKVGQFIQIERRGFFYVDKIACGSQRLTLNFVPDGKSKAMSTISHKLDAKEAAKGKGEQAAAANKADAKKAKQAQEGDAPAADGEEKKLSKKELNKLKKKAEKAEKNKGKKEGAEPAAEKAADVPAAEEEKKAE
jgi:glutamyl-tRNA synthetase